MTSEGKCFYPKNEAGLHHPLLLMSQNRKVKQRTGKKKGEFVDGFRLNL